MPSNSKEYMQKYNKQYNENPENKEKKSAYMKKWNKNNKEHKSAYMKQWRADNPEKVSASNKLYHANNKEQKSIYNKQYYLNNVEKKSEYNKQYNIDNKDYFKQWKIDNLEHILAYKKQYNIDNKELIAQKAQGKSSYLWSMKYRYGLVEEMFIKIYEEQKGLCLGCDIKLISYVLPEERKQYEDDPNLVYRVDYEVAHIDHDHSFERGDPDSVRGLLCNPCNIKNILDPKSKHYIYGGDPMIRETLIKGREIDRILKQWHKEEN